MKPHIAIVGCGRMGTTLSIWLSKSGYPVSGLASEHLSSAEKAASFSNVGTVSDTNWKATPSADVVFITTPDGVISDVCKEISSHKGFKENAVVLHCSGAHPSTILSSARDCGAHIGSMHPAQSMASAQIENNPFKGIIISVEGDAPAIDVARDITQDLGATSYTIKTDGKMLYHASMVVASNYLVTLLNLAFQLLGKAGVPDEDAYMMLKPLINGTLNNIERIGIPAALTGPISRGDLTTVQQHLDAMTAQSFDLSDLYSRLGFDTIDIAKAAGTLSDEIAAELEDLLKKS